MSAKDWAPALSAAGSVADTAGTALSGTAGLVARFIGAALKFGAELAAQGIDPIKHVEKLHAADPLLATVEDGWAKALRDKFPQA